MQISETSDHLNPRFIHQGTSTDLLVKIAQGELNALSLVKKELANRGVDNSGRWVGFERAAEIHKNDIYCIYIDDDVVKRTV